MSLLQLLRLSLHFQFLCLCSIQELQIVLYTIIALVSVTIAMQRVPLRVILFFSLYSIIHSNAHIVMEQVWGNTFIYQNQILKDYHSNHGVMFVVDQVIFTIPRIHVHTVVAQGYELWGIMLMSQQIQESDRAPNLPFGEWYHRFIAYDVGQRTIRISSWRCHYSNCCRYRFSFPCWWLYSVYNTLD